MFGLKRALIRGRITAVELEDEEKEDPNCREYDCRRAARSKKFQTEGGGGKKVKRWRRSARVGPPEG